MFRSVEIPPARASIIVVDDDESVRDAVGDFLARRGFEVRRAEGARSLDAFLDARAADLLIVDVMLPEEDGFSLCRRYSSTGIPILMLSALQSPSHKVVGLTLGAWDYLAKPFDPDELLARVHALLRRSHSDTTFDRQTKGRGGVTFADWWLDAEHRRLCAPSGVPVPLGEREHAVLAAFVARPGVILSRDDLLDAALGPDVEVYDRAVDLAVSRLRRRLSSYDPAPVIETIWGEGYRFVPDVRPA